MSNQEILNHFNKLQNEKIVSLNMGTLLYLDLVEMTANHFNISAKQVNAALDADAMQDMAKIEPTK